MDRTWKPTTAGIMDIIAGVVGIGIGAWVATTGEFLGIATALLPAAGTATIVCGIVAIIGGIFSLRRRVWGLALVGSILAIPCVAILGILAIIFVSLGRHEFE